MDDFEDDDEDDEDEADDEQLAAMKLATASDAVKRALEIFEADILLYAQNPGSYVLYAKGSFFSPLYLCVCVCACAVF